MAGAENGLDQRSLQIKEKLTKNPAIIAISGPSGAGKDYLTQKALEHFATMGVTAHNVQMTTERPHRGEVETKKCITPDAYDALQKSGRLVGDHVNGVRYGYEATELQAALDSARKDGGLVILELNPVKQGEFPAQLKQSLGVDLTCWIGVETTLDQTRANMAERGETADVIEARLRTMQDFINAMDSNPGIKKINNGPTNRQNSAKDFIRAIEDAILK